MQILQKSSNSFQLKTKLKDMFLNPTTEVKEGIAVYSRLGDKNLKYDSSSSDINISSAGEFESQDIFFTGKKIKGSETIIYQINADNISLGLISFVSNSSELDLQFFETTDVLLVQVNNGVESFDPKDAHEMIEKISPKIAIVYGYESNLEEIKRSIPNIKPLEKSMKIEKDDLSRIDNTEIYYFE